MHPNLVGKYKHPRTLSDAHMVSKVMVMTTTTIMTRQGSRIKKNVTVFQY